MLTAACGLVCSDCEAYKATQADDSKWIAGIAEDWSKQFNIDIKPEHVWCDGCLTDSPRKCSNCSDCPVRTCVIERGINNCAECADYGCGTISEFFRMFPCAKERLDSLRADG